MSTTPATRLLTAEEFWHHPDVPEGGKTELVRGEVVVHMPVGGPHSEIAATILLLLGPFCSIHRLGRLGVECGFILARRPDVVRAPDVHFVRMDRLAGGKMPQGFLDGCPDLAVEVVSPDDSDAELSEKVDEYLEAGTPRVWVVRPNRMTVTVHRPNDEARTYRTGEMLTSEEAGFAVDGFELPVAEVFA